jgi:thiamine biosynthesis lipoprotein
MDINHAAGRHPVTVSRPVYQLIKCAKAASMVRDSAFNLAIGPLVKLWRIGFQGHSVPAAQDIAARLALTRPQDVILDDAAGSVFLAQPGMEIDLGAIAKGYIADRVRDYLRQQGVNAALINLGGNVHTLGEWSIGLKKPFAADALIGSIDGGGQSVVTSGIYERYFEQDGKRWHHILDPRSGYPLDNELESVTIISADSLDGDIWTTLIYGLGVEKGCAALRQREDIEAIFVTKNRDIILSSQRRFRFRCWMTATGLLTVLLKQAVLLGDQVVAIDRTPGGAVVDTGVENIDLRQPNQIFAAGTREIFTAAASSSVENSTSGWASIHWQSVRSVWAVRPFGSLRASRLPARRRAAAGRHRPVHNRVDRSSACAFRARR